MLMVKRKIDNVDAVVPLVSDKCDNNWYQITILFVVKISILSKAFEWKNTDNKNVNYIRERRLMSRKFERSRFVTVFENDAARVTARVHSTCLLTPDVPN
jgi:hypothetical protein